MTCPGWRLARRTLEFLPCVLLSVSVMAAPPPVPVSKPPAPITSWIETRVGEKEKAENLFKKVVEGTDPVAIAVLGPETGKNPTRKYSFFVATLLPAWLSLTRETLTNYVVFKEIVPFVDSATYNSKTRVLDLKGGVMGFTLHSFIQFTERHERWISFEIIVGSFRGMKGDLIFEDRDEKGTVVLLTGELSGTSWPPALVMEWGAEMALTVTSGKMRSYIIEKKRSQFDAKAPAAGKPPKGKENDQGLPKPRNRL